EVVAFNSNKEGLETRIKMFVIKQENGVWVIPPYNFPAEAKVRLAKTAASMIGIKRGALVSRLKSDQKKYQVGDPLQFDANTLPLESLGNRITLKGKGEAVLTDMIIGKEHPVRKGLYYVRHPHEDAIWLSQLNIDISTKFSDWINADLLGISGDDIRTVEIKQYALDKKQRLPKIEETNLLSRTSRKTPWEFKGIKKKTEEIQLPHVNEFLNQLTGIKIIGVRKKPQGLNADLSIDQKIIQNQAHLNQIQIDLAEKGFFLGEGKNGQLTLLPHETEIVATTKDGIAYDLYFGQLFTGTEYDIEVGFTNKKKDTSKKENLPKEELKKSRYLFVTARFDIDVLEEIPDKPKKPSEPKEEKKKEEKEPEKKESKKENKDTSNSNKKKPEEKKKASPSPKEVFQKELDKYNSDLIQYKKEIKEYEKKIEEGLKKVDQLNSKFEQWYYVISAESFENLRLTRKDLVKTKSKKKEKLSSPISPPKGLPPGFKIPDFK
ncbi:hypothetical protein MNBD_PLANCTO02-738, partial [hydrothermal vent metagenome]